MSSQERKRGTRRPPKWDRNAQVIGLAAQGSMTLAEIGRQLGISRQRVHQIIKRGW